MMLIDAATGPNIFDVAIAFIQMAGTAFAVYIGYLGTRKFQQNTDTKVDKVHETVNGNLSRAQERAEKYAKMLRARGIDPDTE